jgi:hypothetical protein
MQFLQVCSAVKRILVGNAGGPIIDQEITRSERKRYFIQHPSTPSPLGEAQC